MTSPSSLFLPHCRTSLFNSLRRRMWIYLYFPQQESLNLGLSIEIVAHMNIRRLLPYSPLLTIIFLSRTATVQHRWGLVLLVLKNERKPEQYISSASKPGPEGRYLNRDSNSSLSEYPFYWYWTKTEMGTEKPKEKLGQEQKSECICPTA